MLITCSRYHDFCAGHRVAGHEGKCQHLHGHNYRVHFVIQGDKLDEVGRVIDFSVIKNTLCQWLEDEWDHKFLLWEDDDFRHGLLSYDSSIVLVPFNPTAENMAYYLLNTIGPLLLKTVELIEVTVEETRKCSAKVRKNNGI